MEYVKTFFSTIIIIELCTMVFLLLLFRRSSKRYKIGCSFFAWLLINGLIVMILFVALNHIESWAVIILLYGGVTMTCAYTIYHAGNVSKMIEPFIMLIKTDLRNKVSP